MITFTPIGIIHTPYTELEGMPIQPAGAEGVRGAVELYPEYQAGLQDLEGFSHIILLYHFHRLMLFACPTGNPSVSDVFGLRNSRMISCSSLTLI